MISRVILWQCGDGVFFIIMPIKACNSLENFASSMHPFILTSRHVRSPLPLASVSFSYIHRSGFFFSHFRSLCSYCGITGSDSNFIHSIATKYCVDVDDFNLWLMSQTNKSLSFAVEEESWLKSVAYPRICSCVTSSKWTTADIRFISILALIYAMTVEFA